MNFRLWYGICQLYKNKILTLITLAMLTLSFAVMEYAGMVYLTYSYSRYKAKGVIDFPYGNIYSINLQKYTTGFCNFDDMDKLLRFYRELGKIEGISHAGMFFDNTENDINILYVSEDILPLCGIDIEFSDVDGICSVAGENKSMSCPIGTKLTDYMSGYTLNITGIISDRKFISGNYFSSAGKIIDLDDYIIASLDDIIALDKIFLINGLNDLLYVVDADADKDRVKQDIYNLAYSLEIDIYDINDVDTLFDNMAKEAYEKAGENYLMPLALSLCAIISMIVASYISIIKSRRDMAVMLSNNMTRRDLKAIIYTEISIKILISFILSILYWIVKSIGFDAQTKEMFFMLMPYYIAGMIFTCIVICLFLKGHINKQTPLDMMGEEI